MRSGILTSITGVTLFATLAAPIRLAALGICPIRPQRLTLAGFERASGFRGNNLPGA
jgi:hypothetical protein